MEPVFCKTPCREKSDCWVIVEKSKPSWPIKLLGSSNRNISQMTWVKFLNFCILVGIHRSSTLIRSFNSPVLEFCPEISLYQSESLIFLQKMSPEFLDFLTVQHDDWNNLISFGHWSVLDSMCLFHEVNLVCLRN